MTKWFVNDMGIEVPSVTSQQMRELDRIAVKETEIKPNLIIDALLGYSLQAAPRGRVAELIRWANNTMASVLSLDIPSGVDSATDETPGEFINAQLTMTLALPASKISERTVINLRRQVLFV